MHGTNMKSDIKIFTSMFRLIAMLYVRFEKLACFEDFFGLSSRKYIERQSDASCSKG